MGSDSKKNTQNAFSKEIFSRRLKERRDKNGKMNQTKLANAIHVQQSSIAYYENADSDRLPTIDKLWEMAHFFGCTADYLLGLEDEPTHESTDICKHTGLSNEAVEVLHDAVENGRSDYKLFIDLFEYMLDQFKVSYDENLFPVRKNNETFKIMDNLECAFRSARHELRKTKANDSYNNYKEYEDQVNRSIKLDRYLWRHGEERIKSDAAKGFYLREAADAFRKVLSDFCRTITVENPKYYRKAFLPEDTVLLINAEEHEP